MKRKVQRVHFIFVFHNLAPFCCLFFSNNSRVKVILEGKSAPYFEVLNSSKMSGREVGKHDLDVEDEEREITTFEKYVQSTFAELVGTMFFTFIACLVVTSQDVVAIAFAEGLAMALLCSAFLNIRFDTNILCILA